MNLTTIINSTICDEYIMPLDNWIIDVEESARFTIITYDDDSKWVQLQDKHKERFCGYLYLQQALKELNEPQIQAAENKIAINNRKIIYLSRYYGDEKINLDHEETLKTVGFVDCKTGTNLRKKNNITYIFDTEKTSFDETVRPKIDSFAELHDSIISYLEESSPDVKSPMTQAELDTFINEYRNTHQFFITP